MAVGDVYPNRENPKEAFLRVESFLSQADIAYCQLECIISNLGNPLPGRANYFRVNHNAAESLAQVGFKIVSFAGNHSLDFGYEAFVDTIQRVRAAGIAIVGAGKDLAEARNPVIIERDATKIAFVDASCIIPDGFAATEEKAGIAPLHIATFYEPLEDVFEQPGTPARTVTFPNGSDFERVLDDIRNAKKQADVVVSCFHWGVHHAPDLTMYQPTVAYAAIDAGADLVLGTHPHNLQAFDVYKGKVIAYSLGNFIFDSPTYSRKSAENYELAHYEPSDVRYKGPPQSRKTGILNVDVSDRRTTRVAFQPAFIGDDGRPAILRPNDSKFAEVVGVVSKLSSQVGLDLKLEGEELLIPFKKAKDIDARKALALRKWPYRNLRSLQTQLL